MSSSGLENAKRLVTEYRQGKVQAMTPEIWKAKKIVDSTLHPGMLYSRRARRDSSVLVLDTGQPVLLPFRMSCFVLTNLVVTAGMLTPGLGVRSTVFFVPHHWVLTM